MSNRSFTLLITILGLTAVTAYVRADRALELPGGAVTGGPAVAALPVLPAMVTTSHDAARSAAASSVIRSAPDAQAVLDRYCAACHNERSKAGGFVLTTLDVAQVGPDAESWEKVVRKLRAGLMPPAGRPRPEKAAYLDFTEWLESELDRAAAASPNPGRTEAVHRLNRVQYQNAVRDLLGVELDVAAMLPPDDVSYGFDNIGGVLRMSPTLMERYLSAVKRITRAAVGQPPPFPNFDVFRLADDQPQSDWIEGLPFGTRGGTLIRYNFPADGEYRLRVRLARQTGAQDLDVPRYHQPQTVEVSLDGVPLETFTLPASVPTGIEDDAEATTARRRVPAAAPSESAPPASEGAPAPRPQRVRSDAGQRGTLDADWELTFQAKAGPRDVAVTFLNRAPALLETLVEPYLRPWNVGSNQWSSRRGAYVSSVEIGGPFEVAGVSDTPSRAKIFTCRPATEADEPRCANEILSRLSRLAYRRPVTEGDLDQLMAFYGIGRTGGTFEAGIEFALQRLLMSPDFLFRTALEPAGVAAGDVYRVSDLELASRLSFFLWASIPDDELLSAAERGALQAPGELERQVRRMLADDRARTLATEFAGQWLYLRNVPSLTRDPAMDPDFDFGLRTAFRRETELFVEHILRTDRSVLEFLTADYTFVNERLAKHYGIPMVSGPHFRMVTHVDADRRGLLGHGSVLSVSSYPNRTSPVLRGKWVLENLLGTHAPAPPPDVPDLPEAEGDFHNRTLRQRLEAHRANPVCASCHNLMDPLGFALEGFDASGRRRTVDEIFQPIDMSGVFPDGSDITGPAGLRQALLNHSDSFVYSVTQRLLTYALGRGIYYYDSPSIRAIMRDAARDDYRFASLITAIVKSSPFQMRRAQS